MYKLFMAFRYLRAHKIIYFSIAGVAIGIMTLVVVTSIMSGFARDMRVRIRGMQTHIVVKNFWDNLWIAGYDELCDEIARLPHVEGCAPRIEYDAWMGVRGQKEPVHLVGIVPARERGVSDLEEYWKKGTMPEFGFEPVGGARPGEGDPPPEGEGHPPVVVGSQLRAWTRVGLMTVRDGNGPVVCVRDFEPIGRFHSGMSEYDARYLFMPLEAAQDYLKLRTDGPPVVNLLAVRVDDYEAHGREAREAIVNLLHERDPCDDPSMHRRLGRCKRFQTLTWEQNNRILLQAVEVEKGIQIIVLFLIVLVAGFNIIAIYTLVVRSKSRDIGVLRALGATEPGVTSIFLTSGGLCGLFGSFFGIALGLLLSWNVNPISDFVRVASREMNRMDRGLLGAATILLLAAFCFLIWTWLAFYRERRPTPWFRILATTVLLGAGAWFATAWIPAYERFDRYDPELSPTVRIWIVAGTVGVWALLMAAWRGLDRFRRRPAWIFFGFGGTIVLIAFFLGLLSTLSIATSILTLKPDEWWAGLELFSRQIYYLDRIPVFVDYKALAFIVTMTLIVSVVFSIYPALRAARANPIEAMRDEG